MEHRANCELLTVPTYGLCTCDFDQRMEKPMTKLLDAEKGTDESAVKEQKRWPKDHPMTLARDADMKLISQIAKRAIAAYAANDVFVNERDVVMDITATHFGPCKLDLARLLDADDFNFAHDITGINRHLDREKMVLTDGFSPRFHA